VLRKQCLPFAGTVARTPSRALRLVPEREKVVATHLVIVLYQDRKTLRGRDRRPPFRTHATLGCASLQLRLPLPSFAWMAQPEGQTRELLSYQFSVHGPIV